MSFNPASSSEPSAARTALVLGGGIVGVTTAYFLIKRGFQVTLIEQNPDVGDMTSKANAGLVSAGCSQPWNAPNIPLTVLKTLGRSDSPYAIRLKAFPGIIPWGIRFMLQCRASAYAASCRTSVELVEYSLSQLRELVANETFDYDRQQNGVLKYFEDAGALAQDTRNTEALAEAGLAFQPLSRDETIALEPTLGRHYSRVAGGLYFPHDESGDSSRFAKALAEICRRMGTRILTDTRIDKVHTGAGRITGVTTSRGDLTADSYVLCTGARAADFGAMLNLNLPVYPVKGYSVTIDTDGDIELPQVPFLDWGRKICVTRFGNRIRAAGTAEFIGHDTSPTPSRLEHLHRNLVELFPALEGSTEVRNWAGLRPVTPDGLPILGESPIDNLFLNVGHGPQGWGLSCGCAAVVADVVSGAQPGIKLNGLTYNRRK